MAVFSNLSILLVPFDICVFLTCQLLKLSDYEPRQLGPGWEEQLKAELEARGERLAAVYVRAGCIELLLELIEAHRGVEERGIGAKGAGKGASGDSGSGCSSNGRSNGSSNGSNNGSDAVGIVADLQDPAFLAAILRALGLPSAPAPVAIAGADAGALPRVQVLGSLQGPAPAFIPLPGLQAGPGPRGQASDMTEAQPPISLSLRPRAVLLPTQGFRSGLLVLDLTATGLPHVTLPGQEAGGGGADAGSLLEVLVRSRNRYLPARVRAHAAAVPGGSGCSGGGPEHSVQAGVRFEVELEAEGLQAGLAQVDLRLGGRLLRALPLLLLPAGREDLATELATMEEEEPAEVELVAALGAMEQSDDVGDLVYDLSELLYGDLDERGADALASHLLAYAEVVGLPATAATVRAAVGMWGLPAQEGTACGAAAAGGLPVLAGGGPSCSSCSAAASEQQPSSPAGPRPSASSSARPSAWRDVRWALLLSLGLVREGPEEAEAFRAAADGWAAAQAHIMAGRDSINAFKLGVAVLRVSVSLAAAAAWLLLQPPAWRRLAASVVGARHAVILTSKALLLWLSAPIAGASFHWRGGLLVLDAVPGIRPAPVGSAPAIECC
ncbi:hypothetical protein GPECTOR_8g336 [Gonium pectorale]|uniref:Dolichyl-diphosphooligosaccharide--protein glycosyltransferase subunit 2 n=1 Tax=Gonium pectorale TaxID=33097 RepID=A0A150GT19_GONPE|nr:hypothetical protein GPECTOR_8g336 [Gonium pectorale]|eukprot:KXZ52963.1 hypothetical protein GPECTOR_8g336 [Gonium pectorale]